MDFKGYVDKGWIKPTEPMKLPNGTPVTFTRAKKSASRNGKAMKIKGWKSRSLSELTKDQGTAPLKSLDQLAGDWPRNESIEEFLKSVRKVRK
ncbi:MAG: hypothetical protein AABZ53_16210 [Planctomycetota bacterium]